MKLTSRTFKNRLLSLLTALLFLVQTPPSAKGVCTGAILNPVTDVAWEGMFPMTFGPQRIGASPSNIEPPDTVMTPICACPFPPPIFVRIGIPFSMWEVATYTEVVKDPYCLPSLGTGIGKVGMLGGSSNDQGNEDGAHSKFQTHFFIFPVFTMLDLLVDFACVERGTYDLAYMSELDPTHQRGDLATLVTPESLLFANVIAQAACIADSVSSNAGLPLDPLFWCMGSSGSIYPLGGDMQHSNLLQGSSLAAGRTLFKALRGGITYDKGLYLCSPVHTPIWVKSHFRFQIARPVRGSVHALGRSSMIWGIGKNPPVGGLGAADNFVYMNFHRRQCCAF